MTKYREYYLKMIEENDKLFEDFREVHNRYVLNSEIQEEYNEAGKPIMAIIREYEDRLCNRSEGSGYANYAGNLADKFWSEIRRDYPMIDRVGVIIRKVPVQTQKEDLFQIKQIRISQR